MKFIIQSSRLALCVTVSSLCTALVAQTPSPQNSGAASSVSDREARAVQGSRAKHNTDLFTGTFAYSIPIEAAPARNGSEPQLALTYSSSGEDGWCGVGWSLEIGYIERYTKDGVPVLWSGTPLSPANAYDDDKGFRCNLFGKDRRLIYVAGTNPKEYRAEVDTDFMRFLFNSTANTWDAYDKAGNHYYFGQNADNSSRMKNGKPGWSTGSSGTFRWALDKVVTVTGDQTTIAYVRDGALLYPQFIRYNGHENNNGYSAVLATTHTIEFVTAPRTASKRFSYRSAFRVEQNLLLQRIKCTVGSSPVQPVRRYELAYTYSPTTKALLLQSVQAYGNNDSSTLPAQAFTYSSKPMQFGPSIVTWLDMNVPTTETCWEAVNGADPSFSETLVTDLIDIDGDALPDRVRRSATSPYNSLLFQQNRNVQTDGTGEFATPDSSWAVNSQGATTDPQWSGINSPYTRFIDIDGDGRPDRVMDYRSYYTIPGTAYDRFIVEKNTGTGFSSQQTWSAVDVQGSYNNGGMKSIEKPDSVAMIDLNGDGRPDRVMREIDAPRDYLVIQFGTGSGFLTPGLFGPFSMQGKTQETGLDLPGKMKLVDINGDGLPDRVMMEMANRNPDNNELVPSAARTKFIVEFNNGYSFEEQEWPGVYPQVGVSNGTTDSGDRFALIENFPWVGLFDINGDHLPDRVMTKWDDHSKWLVQINNGTGFEPQAPFSNILVPPDTPDNDAAQWYGISYSTSGETRVALADINGDGLVDRVMADYKAIYNQSGAIAGLQVSTNVGAVPDLLTGVNNGFGGTVAVQYRPSTYWNNRTDPANNNSAGLLPFVVQTVGSIAVSDGINAARTTTYEYEGGFFDGVRREFAGFAATKITDPSLRSEKYWFHQGGGRDVPSNGEYADAGNFAKRGMAYRIETYGNDTPTRLLYNVVVNQVDQVDLGDGRRFPFISQTFEYDYPNVTPNNPKITGSKFVYTAPFPTDPQTYNLTKKTLWGEVSGVNLSGINTPSDVVGGDTQYHQIAYATISGNIYIKDHPETVRLTSDDAGNNTLQEKKYTYNPTSGTLATEQTRICPGYAPNYIGQYSIVGYADYNSYGLATRTTDAAGVVTLVEQFDEAYLASPVRIYPYKVRVRANPGSNNDGLDHISYTKIDPLSGLVTEVTDPMNVKLKHTYDEFFRLKQTDKGTSPGANPSLWVKKLTYTLGGITGGNTSANSVRLQTMQYNDGSDPNGIEAWTYSDGLGREIETRTEAEVAGQFRVVNTFYDPRGEVFLTTWPRLLSGSAFSIPSGTLAASYIGFDEAGRVKETRQRVDAVFNTSGVYQTQGDPPPETYSPLAAKTWAYKNGTDPWWVVCTDEDGKIRRYQLADGFGRTNVIQEVDGASTYTTTLTYDLAGNLTEIINHNNEHIYYGYDDAGRMIAMADPHLGQWTYRRDAAGRLREQTDAKNQKVVFTYGATLSRLSTKQVYNSAQQLVSTATYSYDSGDASHTVYKGQLFQVSDSEGWGWEKNGYDTRGRLQKTTRHLNVNNQDYVTTFGYNDGDKITLTVYPNSGPTVNYEYHPSGALKRTYRSGYDFYTTSAANFDEFGHVTQFTYGNGKVTTRSYYPTSKRLQTISAPSVSRTYRYSAADDVTFISGSGISPDVTITYDNLHRIQNYNVGTSGNYTYDAVGSVTRNSEGGGSSYDYGNARKQAVKTAFGKSYLYDKCGNMTVRHGGTTGSQALDYDAENRLSRFSEAGSLIVEYGYAADGTRLWKRKNQSELQVWIGNIYEEKGGKTLFHVFAGGQRICTFEPGSALAVNGGGGYATHVGYYYHQDHLGSSSALSDSAGTQRELNVWFPFGRTQTANPQATFQVSSRFTGQILDGETGLYYYGARYYDPELGRFIQPDTIIPDLSNPQSYNRYAYALNCPLKYVDPDGHGPRELAESIFNFAGGTIIGAANVWNPVPVQWRWEPPGPSTIAEYYGRRFGESAAVAVSVIETGYGLTFTTGGAGATALSGGSLAIAGVPVAVVGAGMTAHGAVGINNFIFSKKHTRPAGSGRASGYMVGPHGSMPSPRGDARSHHGVMSAWMKAHYKDYDPDKAPAVLMPMEKHEATFGVYNTWRSKMRAKMGGTFDWKRVNEADMRILSEKMFNAASVPKNVRAQYWREFDSMKASLSK